jgi:mannose-6-phosphate isomerase-like protein (cupin superfamily)
MAVVLEGDCRVVGLKEGEPSVEGSLRIWRHFEAALSLRVIELDGEATLTNAEHDETLYVLDGSGVANGVEISRDTGIDLPAGQRLSLTGSMTLVSSLCRSVIPKRSEGPGGVVGAPGVPSIRPGPSLTVGMTRIVRLEDVPRQTTGDRWYCELVQGETTQFVGSIPPGRAPDHFHLYEEVLCILEGSGAMWAGAKSTPIEPGSCVFLPRKQVHCVENKGAGELRLLGVFYPAGSPAVRYPAT